MDGQHLNTTLLTRLAAAALLAAAPCCACALAPARANMHAPLVDLINAYRASPQACEGRRTDSLPALAPQPALARVQIGTGTFLELALERAGYPVERADAISVSGPPDAQAALDAIVPKYCAALLDPQFSAIGVAQADAEWLIVLARPAPPFALARPPDAAEAGQRILAATNLARATARRCGAQYFAAVPAVAWSEALAGAASAHSEEMAVQRYFSHRGKDGSAAAERATQAGYRWQRIGENIAVGQESADEAVAGWLASPGHCANLMNADFTAMGAAFALTRGAGRPRAYWTQVFAKPR